ncbi:MAG: Rrf2 family transcriptional regulator [Terriglobales bacterium]|jgi:Rrf2 family protein
MEITRASDYAVRAMIHLAALPPGSTVRRSDLSESTDVTDHFLSKVLQRLVHAGLIRSQRGSGGGFGLALPAESISLLDVVQAIEGPVRLNLCVLEGPSCDRKQWCPAHKVWEEAQAAVVSVLGAASIARLAVETQIPSAALYQLHDAHAQLSGEPATKVPGPGDEDFAKGS